MDWKKIVKKYPNQWVGLTEVEYEEDNDATIKTAIVKYTNKLKDELTWMQFETSGALIGIYTTPDHVFSLGMIELLS